MCSKNNICIPVSRTYKSNFKEWPWRESSTPCTHYHKPAPHRYQPKPSEEVKGNGPGLTAELPSFEQSCEYCLHRLKHWSDGANLTHKSQRLRALVPKGAWSLIWADWSGLPTSVPDSLRAESKDGNSETPLPTTSSSLAMKRRKWPGQQYECEYFWS